MALTRASMGNVISGQGTYGIQLTNGAASTIFARNTSPCGTVYRAARERSSRNSSSLNCSPGLSRSRTMDTPPGTSDVVSLAATSSTPRCFWYSPC